MNNLRADAMTRAAQIATRELKQLARDAGTRERDFRVSDRRKAITAHLANNPRIMERAVAEVASWKKGRRIRARRTPDFWAVLTTVRDEEKPFP
jgi:hypothetical protein